MTITIEEAVLKVLKESKEPLTPYRISKLTTVHPQGVLACLYRLSSEGVLEFDKKIIDWKECTVWKIR